MEKLLEELYYNPLTGFQGINKLYKKAKELNKKITLKFVKEWLEEQETQQITKEEKKTKRIYDTIISPSVRNNFQSDIMYLPNPSKNKFKYLLTTIDVYSRKAFVQPLKKKDAVDTLKGFQLILKKSGTPKNLNLDEGGEFDNKIFKDFAEKNNITLWFSNPQQENKNAIIERFHRTLRNMLLKYEIALKKPYINDIQTIVENYNNTEHKTIKTTPNLIWKGKEDNTQEVKNVVYDFKEGDRVRYAVKRSAFDKASSTEKYSRDVYTISRIYGKGYYLENKKGVELKKKYRGFELKHAVGGDVKQIEDKEEEKLKRNLKKEMKQLEI